MRNINNLKRVARFRPVPPARNWLLAPLRTPRGF